MPLSFMTRIEIPFFMTVLHFKFLVNLLKKITYYTIWGLPRSKMVKKYVGNSLTPTFDGVSVKNPSFKPGLSP